MQHAARGGLLAAALFLAGALPAGAQVNEPGQAFGPPTAPVRVTGGLVAGVVDSVAGIRLFRGIPYAAPPVGDLRWKPPQAVVRWAGTRVTTAFGPRCAQFPIFDDMVFRSNGVAEDCLYLNVWAPPAGATGAARATAAGQAGRTTRHPVLVYFYGGGFIAGDGSEYRYDGASLARTGIVVVTVNYRLGVFGFLAHPELTRESPHHASGDYGLLDQAAALRWVHDNIKAFGGDPARVTIAGESAGSVSVSALMASPLSRGLIAGAIGESGGSFYPTLPPVPLAQAESAGVRFARQVGAGSLAELRHLSTDSLLQATRTPDARSFPVAVDGWLLPLSVEQIFAAGRQAHVPLLAGWNAEESSGFALLGPLQPTPENWAAYLRREYGARAEEALRHFPGATPEQVLESATLLAGARFIAYSTWKWQELHARTSGQPVYRYFFTRPRPAPKAPTATPPPRGAVHSAEIEYALGNLATNRVYAWTPEDFQVSGLMESYFADFVKTGNPSGASSAAGRPSWPASNAAGTADTPTMIIDVDARAVPEPHRDAYIFLDSVYTAERAQGTARGGDR